VPACAPVGRAAPWAPRGSLPGSQTPARAPTTPVGRCAAYARSALRVRSRLPVWRSRCALTRAARQSTDSSLSPATRPDRQRPTGGLRYRAPTR
jgi:hypothetical protein